MLFYGRYKNAVFVLLHGFAVCVCLYVEKPPKQPCIPCTLTNRLDEYGRYLPGMMMMGRSFVVVAVVFHTIRILCTLNINLHTNFSFDFEYSLHFCFLVCVFVSLYYCLSATCTHNFESDWCQHIRTQIDVAQFSGEFTSASTATERECK